MDIGALYLSKSGDSLDKIVKPGWGKHMKFTIRIGAKEQLAYLSLN